jgi:hypothetical protein
MEPDEIKNVPMKDLKSEDGAEDLADSAMIALHDR